MKNLLYLLFAITLLGCSSNEDESVSDDSQTGKKLLVKSISWTRVGGGYSSSGSEIFTYDGNKILQVLETSRNTKKKFIYTNNLISKIHSFNDQQELVGQTSLDYDDSGRLIYIEESIRGRIEYSASLVYNSSNTEVTYSATETSRPTHKTVFKLNKGSIVSFEDSDGDKGRLSYDNNHNLFKNIIGSSAVWDIWFSFSNELEYQFGSENNLLLIENKKELLTYEYDYNDEGYPRNILLNEVYYNTEFIGTESYLMSVKIEY